MPGIPPVEISDAARSDIVRVVLFLIEKNPDASRRLRARLIEIFDAIAVDPGIGRRWSKTPKNREIRERILRSGNATYVVRYLIEPERITILRVHSAREDR